MLCTNNPNYTNSEKQNHQKRQQAKRLEPQIPFRNCPSTLHLLYILICQLLDRISRPLTLLRTSDHIMRHIHRVELPLVGRVNPRVRSE